MEKILAIPGIYKFINSENSKIYIGSSLNLRKRYFSHVSLLELNKHHSCHFQNAWNKYGKDVFKFEIIEYCDEDDLLIREQYYLDTLIFAQEYIRKEDDRFLKLSYNINPTANSRLGTTQPIDSINKSVLNNPNRKEVYMFDFNGTFIKEFMSGSEAAFENNCAKSSIHKCCKGNQEYVKGYIYCYKENFDNNIDGIADYFESLKESPYVAQVWNKGKHIKFHNHNDKKVKVFTRYGEFIKVFSMQKLATEYINATLANVTKNKNKNIVKNHYVFDYDFDCEEIIENAKIEYEKHCIPHFGNKFKMFDCFNNEISSWNSIRECESLTGLKYGGISQVLCGNRKQYLSFVFKYIEDIV